MSYEQAIMHWRNHRKDRFFQQCSGYVGNGITHEARLTREREDELSRNTMTEILKQNHSFPIYVVQDNIGQWNVVPKNHISGTVIEDQEALRNFALQYAGVGAEQIIATEAKYHQETQAC